MRIADVILLIRNRATLNSVNPDLAVAIAGHETNFVPEKTRLEPKWKYIINVDFYAKQLGITPATELKDQSTSWGPLQVMGSVSRELGYTGYLTALVYPENGVFYAIKKLYALQKKYSNEIDVISAYNWGSIEKDDKGNYLNQLSYVDDVLKRLNRLRMIGGN